MRFILDTEYTLKVDGKLVDQYVNYIDKDGNIDVANVPIAVQGEINGEFKTIGWVHFFRGDPAFFIAEIIKENTRTPIQSICFR